MFGINHHIIHVTKIQLWWVSGLDRGSMNLGAKYVFQSTALKYIFHSLTLLYLIPKWIAAPQCTFCNAHCGAAVDGRCSPKIAANAALLCDPFIKREMVLILKMKAFLQFHSTKKLLNHSL